MFTFLTEKMLLSQESVLGYFLPFVAYAAANTTSYLFNPSLALLLESSTLSLCRMLSISSEHCSTYLPLLFNILQNQVQCVYCATSLKFLKKNGGLSFSFFQELPANVRSTVSVALGDLALRFPNVLEPFTSLIYLRYSIYYVTNPLRVADQSGVCSIGWGIQVHRCGIMFFSC